MKKEKIKYIRQNITRALNLLKDNSIKDDLTHILQASEECFAKVTPIVCFIPVRSRQIHLLDGDLGKWKDRISVEILPGLEDFVDEVEREPSTLAKESIHISDFIVILMQAFQLFPESLMEIVQDSKKWHKPIGIIITGLDRIAEQEKFVEQKRRKFELEMGDSLKKLYFLSPETQQKATTVAPKEALNDILVYVESHQDELRESNILRYLTVNLGNIKSKLNREINVIRSHRQNIDSERKLLQGSFQVNEILSRKVSMFLIGLQEKIEDELGQLNWKSLQSQIVQIYGEIPKDDTFNKAFKESLDSWKSGHIDHSLQDCKEQFLISIGVTASQIEAEFRTYIDNGLKDPTFSVFNNALNKIADNKNWCDNTTKLAEVTLFRVRETVNEYFAEKVVSIINNSVIKALNILRSKEYSEVEKEESLKEEDKQDSEQKEEGEIDNNTKPEEHSEAEEESCKEKDRHNNKKEKERKFDNISKSELQEATLKYLHLIPDKMFEITMEGVISELVDNLRTEIELIVSNSMHEVQKTFITDIESYFRSISDIYVKIGSITNEKYKTMKEISKIIAETIECCNSK
jgi:hypothetical protein